MKKTIYLSFFLILSSCVQQEKRYAEIIIKGADTEFIEVRNPLDDIYIWDMKNDTIYPDENNEFIFKKEILKPEYVTVKIREKYLKTILFPDNKIEIAYIDSAFVFRGNNNAGMKLLNDFQRNYFDIKESSKYVSDSTSRQIQQKIEPQINSELSSLQILIDSLKIEKRFGELLKDEINYYYALRTLQIILSKQYQKTPIEKDLLELFKMTEEKYPLNTTYKPSSWLDYSENILINKQIYDLQAVNLITIDSIQDWYQNDKWIPFQYNLINQHTNLSTAEKASANFIIHTSKQKNFEKSLIKVFEDFKKTYPNSIYSQYLEPEIKIIENYHQKISQEIPINVQFIDGKEISTMAQLINTLKGKKYYVDVWATWCGPCKREFKFNDELNVLLNSKGYEKLYISLDKAELEDKWIQNIKYYDLNGLHILASLDFFKDFEQNYSLHKGYVTIPQYLIIEEDGKIVTNNAPRPSNLSELEKLLTE